MGSSKRFLRARAGSPIRSSRPSGHLEVPPRTRGFTDVPRGRDRGGSGSSAHARVHRLAAILCAAPTWFLRARAGSPMPVGGERMSQTVPPRTRVHRPTTSSSRRRAWFLRARAGSPGKQNVYCELLEVPPRTPGFTLVRDWGARRRPGSSTHARVHQANTSMDHRSPRFLRARAGS